MPIRFLIAVVTCFAVIMAGIRYPNWQFAIAVQAIWLGTLLYAASEAMHGSPRNRFSFVAFIVGALYALNGDVMRIVIYSCFKTFDLGTLLDGQGELINWDDLDRVYYWNAIEPALGSICIAILCFFCVSLVGKLRQIWGRSASKDLLNER